MAPRLHLQTRLESITPNVFFQPPTNVKLSYPCIIYERDYDKTEFGDNNPYSRTLRYSVTVIDRDPDSIIPSQIAALPMCAFNRFFTADNLNHDVFSLFF